MKKNLLNRLFTTVAAITILMILNCATIFAGQTPGHLDSVNSNNISGWAWDSNTPDTPIQVHLYIYKDNEPNAIQVIPVMADKSRDDLAGIYGNGAHGFDYTIDFNSLGGTTYRVEGYAITSSGNLKLDNVLYYSTLNSKGSNIKASLGNFKITAYCPCRSCSAGWGRRTSSGNSAIADHTIAVDPRVIPLGTKVMINNQVYTAQDKGGGVKGNHIDIFFDNHSQVNQFGRKTIEVFVVK